MPAVYDLVVLLDSAAPDDRREKILSDVESAISSGGTLEGKHDWGTRPLSYEIDHRTDAHYTLFQFDGPVELLESLQRTLKLTDGVVRSRLIKLKPGTPPPPNVRPAPPVEAGAPASAPEAPAATDEAASEPAAPAEPPAAEEAAPEPIAEEPAPAAAEEPAPTGDAPEPEAAPADEAPAS
jgi:small subunit ribosomal protein S6